MYRGLRGVVITVLVLLVASTSSGITPGLTDAVIEYNPDAGFDLGIGYDPVSLQLGNDACVSWESVNEATPGGQEVTSSFKRVSSTSDLLKELGASASATFSYGVFKGTASANVARSTNVNSSTSVYLANILVNLAAPRQLVNPRLSAEALALLDSGINQFRNVCGDYFVHGITYGGQYVATVSVSTNSIADKMSVEAALDIEVASVGGGGGVSGSTQSTVQSVQKDHHVEIREYSRGGSGAPSAVTVEQMATNYNGFTQKVAENPYPVRVILRPYVHLINWPQDKLPLAAVQTAVTQLSNLARDYAAYQDVANDVDYMLNQNNWAEFRTDMSSATPALQGIRKAILNPGDGSGNGEIDKIVQALVSCGENPATCSMPSYTKAAADYRAMLPARWQKLCTQPTLTVADIGPITLPDEIVQKIDGNGSLGDDIFRPPTLLVRSSYSISNDGRQVVLDPGSYYHITADPRASSTVYGATFASLPPASRVLATVPDNCKVASLQPLGNTFTVLARQDDQHAFAYENSDTQGRVKTITCEWHPYFGKCSSITLRGFTATLASIE
jgi:hypothetical protein